MDWLHRVFTGEMFRRRPIDKFQTDPLPVVETSMVRLRRVLSMCWVARAIGWEAAAMAGPADDLIDAAHRGDAAAVRALLAKGGDVNTVDNHGWTMLMTASQHGHLDVVQALLATGADVNAKASGGGTALRWASGKGHLDIVQALLARGADVNAKTNDGATALMWASGKGHLDIVQALLAKGADVNAKCSTGWTALMWASHSRRYGRLDIVQELLAKGTDVNAKSDDGWTALILASRYGRLDIVQALLAKGADVNAKSDNGRTALILASRSGQIDVVQELLAKGATSMPRRTAARPRWMRRRQPISAPYWCRQAPNHDCINPSSARPQSRIAPLRELAPVAKLLHSAPPCWGWQSARCPIFERSLQQDKGHGSSRARAKHRGEWPCTDRATIWLAVHFPETGQSSRFAAR